MRTRPMTHFDKKVLIAGLLPLSFLWTFMACVSICERDTLQNHSSADLSCSIEANKVREAPGCEECPLSYFPRSTAPERAKFILPLQSLSTFVLPGPAINSTCQENSSDWLDSPLSDSSPPLKLLSALRI